MAAHALLKQTLKRTMCQNINVLVTSGSLIPSLAKCLLYQLDDVIPANNGMISVSSIGFFPLFLFEYGNVDETLFLSSEGK